MNSAAQVAQPREGSTSYRALEVIAAKGGRVEEGDLADALDLTRLQLTQQLNYAIRQGVLRRSRFGDASFYTAGAGAADAADVQEQETSAPAWADPTPPPAEPAPITATAIGHTHDFPPAPPGSKTGPVPIAPSQPTQARRTAARIPARRDAGEPEIHVPRFLDAHATDDLVDVVREAADRAGIAVGTLPSPGQGISVTHAREVISAVLPVLEVGTIELARYTDGRVLLEIDGVSCILPPALANKAFAFFAGGKP